MGASIATLPKDIWLGAPLLMSARSARRITTDATTKTAPTDLDFPKLFCFGDSLTQRCFNVTDGCWGSIIASRYQRQVDVINRGFSGYTSRQAIHFLQRLLRAFTQKETSGSSIAAVVIWFGANDACTPENPVHVPVNEYGVNLNKMVDQAVSCGVPTSRIILVTPPEYDHEMWKKHLLAENRLSDCDARAAGRSKSYAEKCVEVAKKRDTLLVDVHSAMTAKSDWSVLLVDGLHFNTKGAQFVADLFVPILDPLLSVLPVMFPLSADSERDDPKDELTNWMPPRTQSP